VGGGIFSNVGFINICALKKLPLLEYLSIGDFGEIDLDMICDVKQLKELCIGWGGNAFNCEKLKELTNLTSLVLYDIKIKSLGFLNELSTNINLNLGGLEVEEEFDLDSLKRFEKCEHEMLLINGRLR